MGVLDFGCEAAVRNERGMRADGTFRTKYGGFDHDGKIYENSNANVSVATRRIFRAAGGSIAIANKLRDNQSKFISENTAFLEDLQNLYAPVMSNFRGFLVEAEDHYDDPHAKRSLREQAWKELFETGKVTDDIWLQYTIYKMKKDEFAKPGTEPRMIGDLQVPASLEGFMVTKYLKEAMQRDVELPGGTLHFCATPDHDALTDVFANLLSPKKRVYMSLFSDDSCVSIRQENGEVTVYNMDISSCDASHTGSLFWALGQITTGLARDNIVRLIKQLQTKIRIYDLSRPTRGSRKRYAEFVKKDGSPTLYSGSTLTTAINNLANILIGCSIILSNATTSAEIIAAAEAVGYIVTLERCEIPEDIQFLKHSPVRDIHGILRPLLNIGVLFRTMGTAKGDVPGRSNTPLRERFAAFEYALMQGMYPRSHFPFVDIRKEALRGSNDKLAADCERRVQRMLTHRVGTTTEHHFRSEDVYRRYRLTPAEILLLDVDIANQQFDTFHACSAANKVFRTDYGLSCPTLNQ
jgi:hypothetical protein